MSEIEKLQHSTGHDHQSTLPSDQDHYHHHEDIPASIEILATDTNPVSLKCLVALLLKSGFKVTATTKADAALDLLRNNKDKFNMVITDLVRLDMDGFKLLETICLEMDIPVIIVSADDKASSARRAIKCGARDYILKPIKLLHAQNLWQHVVRKNLDNNETLKRKRSEEDEEEKEEDAEVIPNTSPSTSARRKPRIQWTNELHQKFLNAIQSLGFNNAVPSGILEAMEVPELSRENVASHLQKYRNMLRKQNGMEAQESSSSSKNTENIPRNEYHRHFGKHSNIGRTSFDGLKCSYESKYSNMNPSIMGMQKRKVPNYINGTTNLLPNHPCVLPYPYNNNNNNNNNNFIGNLLSTKLNQTTQFGAYNLPGPPQNVFPDQHLINEVLFQNALSGSGEQSQMSFNCELEDIISGL